MGARSLSARFGSISNERLRAAPSRGAAGGLAKSQTCWLMPGGGGTVMFRASSSPAKSRRRIRGQLGLFRRAHDLQI